MRRGKIIVYSPKPFLAEMIAEIIGYADGDITTCDNIEFLEEWCRHVRVNLVIVIAVAPFLNGSKLVTRLRQCGHIPAIYVISWQHTEQTVLSLIECGVDQYMTFPICIGRLKNKTTTGSKTKKS